MLMLMKAGYFATRKAARRSNLLILRPCLHRSYLATCACEVMPFVCICSLSAFGRYVELAGLIGRLLFVCVSVREKESENERESCSFGFGVALDYSMAVW